MKQLLPFVAAVALAGGAAAQQMTPLSQSADLTLTPGAAVTPVNALGARATTACDDFNRAALGPDWVAAGGSPEIFNNMFGSGSGNSMAQHATASVNYDSAVISFDLPDNPTTLTYGAAVHGLGGSQNTFVKIQRNGFSAGLYDTLGFYVGFNGGGGPWTGGGFFAITGVVGGYVEVYIDPASGGDVMNVDIDEDRDGVVDYTYTAAGVLGLAGGFGTSIGLGAYGSAFGSLDDFELNGGCAPTGPSLTATGTAGGTMTFDYAGFAGGEQIATVYGPAGSLSGNAPCGSVTVDLVPLNYPPVSQLIILTADANGDAQLVQGVPAAGAGLLVQGVGLTGCLTSNTVTIQ